MTTAQLAALLPLLVPAAGSILVLLLGAVVPGRYTYGLAVLTSLWTLIWMLFPGLTSDAVPGFMLDGRGRLFAVIASLAAVTALLLSRRYNRFRGITGEEYPASVLFTLTAMIAACGATDLMVLFLGMEGFTFGLYLLVSADRRSLLGSEAGVKFLLNGTVAAALVGMGLALLYSATGTLVLRDLLGSAAECDQHLLLLAAVFLLAGLAFKFSLVPFHIWTPDIYQGAPAPVAAFLGGSKAVAFGAVIPLMLVLLRLGPVKTILWWMVLISMVVGSFAALRQQSLKRLLGWSAVAQFGTIGVGLIAGGVRGAAAAFVLAIAYCIASMAALGAVSVQSGRLERHYLDDWAGMGRKAPLAGVVLATAMLSMAGIPPTFGFVGKFTIFLAALDSGQILLAVTAAATSLVSAAYCLKVISVLYLEHEACWSPRRMGFGESAILFALLLLILVLGVFPGALLDMVTGVASACCLPG